MRSPRVLILYNEPVLPETHPDADSEHEILFTTDVVSKILLQAGFEVTRLGASHDPGPLVTGLRAQRPDVVFNLFEGTGDNADNEAYVAGVLEWLGIPFTGSPSRTLCLARNKHLTKHLFRGAGLPTADFFVVEKLPLPEHDVEWPLIVKPATQDASVGLDQGSVVTDKQKLEERVALVLKTYGPPVLVEQFIRGRELTVGLLEAPELKVLPVSEVLFVDKDPNFWPIVTYDAKWKPGTRDYESTPPRYPADVSPKLAEKLGALATEAFRLLGCRDYARVDFRVRSSGKAYLLEVNPNPDFSPNAGFSGGLSSAGLTHAQFTVDMVRHALARHEKARPVPAAPKALPEARSACAEDMPALRKLSENCDVFRPEELTAIFQQVAAVLESGKESKCHCFVADWQGQPAGFVCIVPAPLSEWTYQILGLAVAPGVQGHGIGWQLFQAAEKAVAAAGGRVLLVETSSQPAGNQARQFCQRQGFRLVGDVPDYFGEAEARLTYAKYLAEKQ